MKAPLTEPPGRLWRVRIHGLRSVKKLTNTGKTHTAYISKKISAPKGW